MKTAKQDNEIMRLLKVSEISRIICDTNMGTLKLRIRKGETKYQFVLDAVELPKELNNELMEAIYPQVQDVSAESFIIEARNAIENNPSLKADIEKIKSKGGRPVGSKNKTNGGAK